MQTIKRVAACATEVNRSKFLSFLVPICEFSGFQEKLKARHPKADHVVYALRTLNEWGRIVENSSDDGEPKGCAGIPVLNVLRGGEMIECAVLIVRYFGGIKLGTGGMARAYAQAAKNVLSAADIVLYEKQIIHTFQTSYGDINETVYRLKKADICEFEREFLADCVKWKVIGSKKHIDRFLGQT